MTAGGWKRWFSIVYITLRPPTTTTHPTLSLHCLYTIKYSMQGQTGRVFSTSGRVGFGYWKNISGRVGYRVFVSNTKSIGYYGVLKSWSGIRRVSPLFPILSNIYYLIWLIWSIKHVFGRHIYVIVVQCGRSWQPFGDRRKSHKPLESAHLQNFATKMPYL